jgi:hypothetical protein
MPAAIIIVLGFMTTSPFSYLFVSAS